VFLVGNHGHDHCLLGITLEDFNLDLFFGRLLMGGQTVPTIQTKVFFTITPDKDRRELISAADLLGVVVDHLFVRLHPDFESGITGDFTDFD